MRFIAVKLHKVISQHFQSTVSGFTDLVFDKKVTLVNLYGLLIFQKNDENNFLWWFLKFFVKTKERVVFHCLLKMIKLTIYIQTCIFGQYSKRRILNEGDHVLGLQNQSTLEYYPGIITKIEEDQISISFCNDTR